MSNIVKLKNISKTIGSGITPLRSNPLFWENGTIPWLKTEQLGEHEIYETSEKISQYAIDETSIKIFPKNTLSIAMYGEGRTRGNVSILKAEMTTNQACCNIVIDKQIADYEYVYYFLKTQYINLRSLSSGVRKNLNSNDIKEFEIRLPKDLQTQKKIAKVLSDLDAKIELNNAINDNLEQMAKTLYDYWFVQFDFPDANGKPYKSSGGKMVWNIELNRDIPVDWEVGTLDSIGDIIGGSTPSKAIDDNFCYGEGTPWITPKDLSNNKGKKYITRGEYDVTKRGLKEASLKIMPTGTILLSSRAPIGYLAIARTNVTTNQGFKSFVPKSIFSSEYIFFTIQSLIPEIEANSSGSTFKEVSTSTLRTIKTILPTNEVLLAFYSLIKPTFRKQDSVELENQELALLRDWLLPMLMNGQVKVQD